jgi:hypothetical protein
MGGKIGARVMFVTLQAVFAGKSPDEWRVHGRDWSGYTRAGACFACAPTTACAAETIA